MGSGGVAIAALPTVICLKVPFSDGLGGVTIDTRIIKKDMIMIGMDTGSACLPNNVATHLYLSGNNSKIIFKGSCIISNGTGIRIDNCHLSIGNNFYCNSGCFLKLTEDTDIGNDCMFGWNITLSTSDGHNVIKGNKHISMQGPINIDDHVWVCSNSTLTKNSYIREVLLFHNTH